MVAANERTALTFSLSGGQAHDAPEGRALLEAWDKPLTGLPHKDVMCHRSPPNRLPMKLPGSAKAI